MLLQSGTDYLIREAFSVSRNKNRRSSGNRAYRLIYIVILAIFVYVGVQSFFLARSDKTTYVTAESGSLQNILEYTGVITRQEQVVYSSAAGACEYLYPASRHVSKGTVVCSILDPDYGTLLKEKVSELYQEMLREAGTGEYAGEFAKLNETVVSELTDYTLGKSGSAMGRLYELKANVQQTLGERGNIFMMSQNERVKALLAEQGVYEDKMDEDSVEVSVPYAGMICYTHDGYEGWTAEQVTPAFAEEYTGSYETIASNLQKVKNGDPLYRLVTGENWEITFFAREADGREWEEGDTVSFYIGTREVSGTVSKITNVSGGIKVVISMDSWLEEYADTRLVSVRFIRGGQTGIKIPISCIRTQTYYRIPESYRYKSGDRSGIMVRSGSGDSFYPVTFAWEETTENGEIYLYFRLPEGVSDGAKILQHGTTSTLSLGDARELSYVCTVNGGYQEEKVVQILSQSDAYAVVEGIKLYDRVLVP